MSEIPEYLKSTVDLMIDAAALHEQKKMMHLQSLIGSIGNELHNLSCEYQNNDHLRDRISEISSRAWELSSRAGRLDHLKEYLK